MDNIKFNRKTRQEIQYRYILNAIQIANRDVQFLTHKEMCEYIVNEWHWDNDMSGAKLTTDAFAEWLREKPICIAIPHYEGLIKQTGRAWGYCKTENSTNRFVETWYERIAQKFIQICKKLNVEL